MKIKSLYVSAQEGGAGSLFVTMGMMQLLKRNLHKVAFFRPIVSSKDEIDKDIDFMLKRFKLDMEYEECYGFDIGYVEEMIALSKENELIEQLIEKFKNIEKNYDFILCEGIRHSFLTSTISYDLNVKIAQNLGSAYINVVNAKDMDKKEIFENVLIENDYATSQGCIHFATFINRVDERFYDDIVEQFKSCKYTVFFLKEMQELSFATLQDVIDSLDAKGVVLSEFDAHRVIRDVKVAALSLDNFLDQIEEDDLVIVPADRSDILLGLLCSLYSNNYPNINGIVCPFDMHMHKNIKKMILGFKNINMPMLSVSGNTYTTASKIKNIRPRLRVDSERKIALALGLFNSSVDVGMIEQKIKTTYNDVITPQMFEYKLFDKAHKDKKRIVLPESEDERILRATEIILRRDIADIVLLGDEDEIKQRAKRLGLNIENAEFVDHTSKNMIDGFAEKFYEIRKAKGLNLDAAKDIVMHKNYFATMMVESGMVDGMVSGASHSTADTIRPALQIIKTIPGVSKVSSLFFMCFDTKVLIYGDCAINQDPDEDTLADIAIASAKTALAFEIEPRVAMLSYSTGESGSGEDVEKVRKATQIAKQKAPKLLVEGPIQYDAAINQEVADKKLKDSKVAGKATVFIFPDLNTGNNTYKAVQRSSGAIAIGPIIQGLKKPINDLSRGCLVADIVNTVAITAIQASQNQTGTKL